MKKNEKKCNFIETLYIYLRYSIREANEP